MRKLLPLIGLMFLCFLGKTQLLYDEEYRPQYHLSPESGWMGDPDGMVFYNGKYHLMWWGHAISEDLVHWVNYNNNSMSGGPGGFGYWSGSVVVDEKNTAGFNTTDKTAMVAIYTMHYNNTNYEKVGISSSLNHVGFNYYSGNPVIDINQKDVRDPQVFWHEGTNRWIMVIARAIDRAVEFLASSDLKNWTHLSTFSPRGAKDQVWEVPDLFQLPLNNNQADKKWVLTCGMGPNRVQFWVGDFDGTKFKLDTLENHYTGKPISGTVFENFEGDNYGKWQATGDAFGTKPVAGTLPDQMSTGGFIGKSFVNSYRNGDASTGKMISPEFKIQNRFINFLIGGGTNSYNLAIKLYINGEVIFSNTSPQNQETLRWSGWDVSQFIGKTAHIEIIDNATGSWGHILVDHIVFSDILYNTKMENGNWADWGKDFYAARSFRNYSVNPNDRTVWIAWMGNWEYANSTPTSVWKGNQSIPRSLNLTYDENGYQLRQEPIEELQTLRKDHFSIGQTLVNGSLKISGFQPSWNVFEIKTSFKIRSANQVLGINLAEDGSGKKLIVGYDANTSNLFIDRRNAGLTNFNSAFPSIMRAPVTLPTDSILTLHIFMDQSSVEVFANNYKTQMSALVYTKKTETGISLFSDNVPATMLSFEAWKLNSIWDIVPTSSRSYKFQEENQLKIFPNPAYDKISIQTIENSGQMCVFSIYNTLGEKVYNKSVELRGTEYVIDVHKLKSGLYYLSVQNGETTERKSFIKI